MHESKVIKILIIDHWSQVPILIISSATLLNRHIFYQAILLSVTIYWIYLHSPALAVVTLLLLIFVSHRLWISYLIVDGSSLLAISFSHQITIVIDRLIVISVVLILALIVYAIIVVQKGLRTIRISSVWYKELLLLQILLLLIL